MVGKAVEICFSKLVRYLFTGIQLNLRECFLRSIFFLGLAFEVKILLEFVEQELELNNMYNVGFSDGVVRVFSQDPDRQADPPTLATYQQDIANFGKADEQEIGGVKISE